MFICVGLVSELADSLITHSLKDKSLLRIPVELVSTRIYRAELLFVKKS